MKIGRKTTKEGVTVFNAQFFDRLGSRDQEIYALIQAGELCEDDAVRNKQGTVVDFCEDGEWFDSKNRAIDYLIAKLLETKDV